MVRSNFFPDASNAARAMVKILAGAELGIGPVESMRTFYIVDSKIEFAAEALAIRVKRSARYDYRVLELTNDVCEIAFFENGEEIGRSRFDDADRVAAGFEKEGHGTHGPYVTTWGKFPRNMFFARALSNGVAWFCPDVTAGITSDGSSGDAPVLDPSETTAEASPDPSVVDAGGGSALSSRPASERATDDGMVSGENPERRSSIASAHETPSSVAEPSDGEGQDAGDHEAPAPPSDIHEHVAGDKHTASGKALCIYELSTGLTCGKPFRPAPTVHTAPITPDEERKDLVS
jgi:hypothetical protein